MGDNIKEIDKGLYLPKSIDMQKFSNVYDLDMQPRDNGYFIDLDEFRKLYKFKREMFFNAIFEFEFRSGYFITSNKGYNNRFFPKYYLPERVRLIVINDNKKAGKSIDELEILKINDSLKSMDINFFNDLRGTCLESFKTLGVKENDFVLLEKILLDNGCKFQEGRLTYPIEIYPPVKEWKKNTQGENANLVMETEESVMKNDWYRDIIIKCELSKFTKQNVQVGCKSVTKRSFLQNMQYYSGQIKVNLDQFILFNRLLSASDLFEFMSLMDIELKERELDVLECRLIDQTLEEIGNRFDLTRERIRQIELNAFRKIHPKLIEKGFLEYVRNNKIIIQNNKVVKYVLKNSKIECVYYDADLDIIYNHKGGKTVDDIKYIIDIVDKNKITSIKKLEDELLNNFHFNLSDLDKFFDNEKFQITNDFIIKKRVYNKDIFQYILMNFYKSATLDLSTEAGFNDFLEKISYLGIDLKDIDLVKYDDKILRKMRATIERIDEVLKVGTSKYRYFDFSAIPINLISKVERNLRDEINCYGFVTVKKLYRNFADELLNNDIEEDGLFYILKLLLDTEFKFYGKSSSFCIFNIEEEPCSLHQLIYRLLEQNGGTMSIETIVETMAVERYTIDSLAQKNLIIIDGDKVVLYDKIHDNVNYSENSKIISELYEDKLDNEGYVSIRNFYDYCILDESLNQTLRELGADSFDRFKPILSMVTGGNIGNNLITYKNEAEFGLIDLVFEKNGSGDEIYRKQIEDILMNLGLSSPTSAQYLNGFIDDNLLIPIDSDRYYREKFFNIEDDFIREVKSVVMTLIDKDYISVQNLEKNFYMLPESPTGSWSVPFLAYILCRYLGYRQLKDFTFNYDIDPYILVPKESDLNYREIIRLEMENFRGYPIENNILYYLKGLGLMPNEARVLYEKFFKLGIFVEDELGKISTI